MIYFKRGASLRASLRSNIFRKIINLLVLSKLFGCFLIPLEACVNFLRHSVATISLAGKVSCSQVAFSLNFISVLSIISFCKTQNRSAPNPPKPMYEMDESKLLIPVLPWGAAEQMRGFRESLLMGFFMNRTVCVPPFWRERSPSAFKVALSKLTCSRIFRWLGRGFQLVPE